MTNLAVSQAVAPDHFYPPDPSSQVVCSIGGNVAENSGGAHCFKYGFTINYVTGLEVVLAGRRAGQARGRGARPARATTSSARSSAPRARSGSRLRITVRVVPKPESVRTLVAFFDTPVEAGEVVSAIVAAGIVPAAIEMMDKLSIRAAEGATGAGYPERRGRGAGGRARRRRGRVRAAASSRSSRSARDGGASGGARRARRGRARADLEDAQGGVRGDGADRAELLRPGQRHPAHASWPRSCAGSTSSSRGVRAAGGERLPRRRRQPPSARLLRRRRARARPSAPRSSPG